MFSQEPELLALQVEVIGPLGLETSLLPAVYNRAGDHNSR